ncbi:MAG TPA: UDP-N-acetylmuramoylalanyl-D-glutamyl-2,6-diaminopimelate--D-alanyl-D-alanine ligase [Xanthobacteraceae bacterium]|nr:UDP-N-acetylmuramoylalanyl-D-glutamyl-2,6-diaminopimelate--D-alanyl-D-alanine ligase [Xanthobacteraceae bacterium]
MTAPLWTLDAIAAATRAQCVGPLPQIVTGISIDSRTVTAGEAFFAIKGDTHDGHDFVAAALERSAGLAVVAWNRAGGYGSDAPLIVVEDVLEALRDIARAARLRSAAKIVAVTGSVGKTSTKEALVLALASSGETHASAASFNNHWGVPLSLARMAQTARYGVFEIGMNHAGEITPLVHMVRPQVAIVTAVEPVHLEFFASVAAIADAKAEIFKGVERGGAAVVNRDNRHFARLRRRAEEAGVQQFVSFGEHAGADARLLKCALHPDCSTVEATILGQAVTYKIGAPGRHLVTNSLAVLAAACIVGADLARAALALARQIPAAGRGTRVTLELPEGRALVIDESYNANPASMRAALALLGQAPLGPGGRRIAVIGDMLELGPTSEDLHRGLVEAIRHNGIDLVYCAGPLMAALWEALPSARRGGYAKTAAELEPLVLAVVRAGDALMVKASAGSHFGPIVKALVRRHSVTTAPEPAQARG